MSKPDIAADEQKEANEIAAQLSCCVADLMTADFAADDRVIGVIKRAMYRGTTLVGNIRARRRCSQRQREAERWSNVHGATFEETTPGDLNQKLKDIWEQLEQAAKRGPSPKYSTASFRFASGEPLHFEGLKFNFNTGPGVKSNATKRTPHDEWRYALREIAGDAWREGMSDAALFKAAQIKAHPDRCGGDGTLFKKVTDLGQRLGVVDDKGRVKI